MDLYGSGLEIGKVMLILGNCGEVVEGSEGNFTFGDLKYQDNW